MESKKQFSKKALFFVLVSTLLYWGWESQAEGNIRIDLLVLYPALFFVYLRAFWVRFKFLSILLSTGLMMLNIVFFMLSYDLFGKNPG